MNRLRSIMAVAALGASLAAVSGCALPKVLGGDTSACGAAESQLATAKGYAAAVQIALATAEALSNAPLIRSLQASLDLINGDIDKFQALVTAKCAAPTLAPHILTKGATVPTALQADKMLERDKALADAAKAGT